MSTILTLKLADTAILKDGFCVALLIRTETSPNYIITIIIIIIIVVVL
jgi:hypothetical protein